MTRGNAEVSNRSVHCPFQSPVSESEFRQITTPYIGRSSQKTSFETHLASGYPHDK